MKPTQTDVISALDARAVEGRDWALAKIGGDAEVAFRPASADASFRRYFRLSDGDASWILMDAPPQQEDTAPFVRVAELMHQAGLNAPRVLAQDSARGYLLLSDLGKQTFLDVIRADGTTPEAAETLMLAAIDALLEWQQSSRPGVLPPYDAALLQRELDLFEDWYVARHLQRTLTPPQKAALRGIQQLLIDSALAQAPVFVHRDYMPRNLMVSASGPGILDFQDAVEGPISYDVVSLVRDAFWSWPADRVDAWMRRYWALARERGLPVDADYAEFRRAADWMGLQRHLKVIGIFARINYRDGKPHYLADVPRFIAYVRSVAADYPAMAPLLQLFDELDLRASS
ncbi:aminoglycoside phosphotransferase [Sinimarinibacterium sp. CAU 1509]|uniref:aminoglycoside phosphotransferase family protein n=1 Tax=Sinimarinibacterium sp. CAU 1509 TaxID=2562283 RepID=UPI0010AC098A|nr:phosphotransferase [Sinimarinibacterium sp. CAU 1509]TJY56697.1 aminoglycoside phosphotransferase [Sinimarinibacterium sp. CAU 1509]